MLLIDKTKETDTGGTRKTRRNYMNSNPQSKIEQDMDLE
jgi:hypothetical protein